MATTVCGHGCGQQVCGDTTTHFRANFDTVTVWHRVCNINCNREFRQTGRRWSIPPRLKGLSTGQIDSDRFRWRSSSTTAGTKVQVVSVKRSCWARLIGVFKSVLARQRATWEHQTCSTPNHCMKAIGASFQLDALHQPIDPQKWQWCVPIKRSRRAHSIGTTGSPVGAVVYELRK